MKTDEITLSEQHPDRLKSQHTLASFYKADGQIQRSIQLLEHVVRIRKIALTKYHPNRVISEHALADVYKIFTRGMIRPGRLQSH